jgi:hypothetical protein
VRVVNPRQQTGEEVMSIDGRGMFLTCKYAIEQMLITGAVRRGILWLANLVTVAVGTDSVCLAKI